MHLFCQEIQATVMPLKRTTLPVSVMGGATGDAVVGWEEDWGGGAEEGAFPGRRAR